METVRQIFAAAGLRHTRQRELVYRALAETRLHPTAEELFNTVRSREAGLSLATVYNTLDVLAARGLCRRLACPSGACRYDADVSDHVHVNTTDGRILDVPAELSERLLAHLPAAVLAELEGRLGVRVQGISVQIRAEAGRGR